MKKTGIEHGTLTLVLEKQHFEITTLRKDVSTDGRHASVYSPTIGKKTSKKRFYFQRNSYERKKVKFLTHTLEFRLKK